MRQFRAQHDRRRPFGTARAMRGLACIALDKIAIIIIGDNPPPL